MVRGLPYDAEVEYIASTGTQRIDTGVVPTIDTSAELDVSEVEWTGWNVLLGSASSDNSVDAWCFRSGGEGPDYSFRIDGRSLDKVFHVPLGTRFAASCSKHTFTVNG